MKTDLLSALRQLRRHKGCAATAILTLTLGMIRSSAALNPLLEVLKADESREVRKRPGP